MEEFAFIDLTKKERRLFGVPRFCMQLVDIDCDSTIDSLAKKRAALDQRQRFPSMTDMSIGFDFKRHEKQVELFVAVAHRVLLHELDGLLVDPQKLNRDDL